MSGQVKPGDLRVITRGLIVLAAIVVIGVGVAEHQLNTLTQRPEQERFFYIGRSREHVYSAYVFGHGVSLENIYPLGTVERSAQSVRLHIGGHSLVIPTKIEINGLRALYWLDIWRGQFVEEAFRVRKKVAEYWTQCKPYIENGLQTLQTEGRRFSQQIGEYLREYR